MAKDDDMANWPGASQAAGEILPAVPLQGDFGRPGRSGIDFEPMSPGRTLKDLKTKTRGRATPFGLTPVSRGHNISLERGVYFLRPN